MPFSDRFVELRAPSGGWRQWHIVALILATMTVLSVGSGAGLLWYFSTELPDIEAIEEHRPNLVSRVYSDEREVVGQFYIERRFLTPLPQIPDSLVEAIISVEDVRFFDHPGLDIIGIMRAAWTNFRRGGRVEGASTITQQLARSLFLTPERTYTRKLKELILAYRIESKLTKEQILEMYLNQIYFGHGAYGVRAAAQTFFGKSLVDLTLQESALLAGLPKSPNNYSPYRNPKRAKRRQEHVLGRMEEARFITAGERIQAVEIPLQYHRPEVTSIAPYFIEHVRQHLVAAHGEKAVLTGGLDVYTTLNVAMQKAAEAAVNRGLRTLDKRQGWRGPLRTLGDDELTALTAAREEGEAVLPKEGKVVRGIVTGVGRSAADVQVGLVTGRLNFKDMAWARRQLKGPDPIKDAVTLLSVKDLLRLGDEIEVALKTATEGEVSWTLEQTPVVEGALIAIDPRNGAIRALVGGYDFLRSEYNRAIMARRQPGSAFKPIIYGAAISQGLSPATMLVDAPVVYVDEETEKIWKPENYEKRFYGVITLRDALIHSRNLATVRLLERIGIKPATEFARLLGISSPLNYDLSFALGSSSISLAELTSAYGVFANQGILLRPYAIATVLDANGQTLEQTLFEPQQVLPKEVAYLVTNMLQDVIQRGTGRRAKVIKHRSIAGKTGTTNDFTDAWFVGFTPNLALGVWVGFDDRRPLGERESGANAALPIWIEFMQAALKHLAVMPFEIPDDILFVKVDPETGLLPSDDGNKASVEIFAKGSEPTKRAPQRLDPLEFYEVDRYREPSKLRPSLLQDSAVSSLQPQHEDAQQPPAPASTEGPPETVSPGPAVHASVSEGPRQRSNEQNSEAGE